MRKLNSNQEKAVTWMDGPCLVLAGPGSGKTFVLVNRILNLIRQGVNPDSILIITFTRAAANEMRERFYTLLRDENVKISVMPTFGTFHSIFYEILKNDFGYTKDSLISDIDEKRILFNVIEKRNDLNVTIETVDNILADISKYKLSIECGEVFKPKFLSSAVFYDIYTKYSERLFDEKKLDFYGMIYKCHELLKNNNDVLDYYKNKYQYILIDEFQDINKSQYDIVKLICDTNNLFVVGDDDQSIYRFRGSHPKVMSDFLSDFKKAKKIILNENYRCAKVIVKYSKKVVSNNHDRFEKNLVSKRDDIGTFELKSFDDSILESRYIVDKIRYYRLRGIKLSEMAILYRTNLLSSAIAKSLISYNIPYVIKGENNSIYDHFAVKDIISYLKIAISKYEMEDFIRIVNKPLRYISRDAIGFENASIDSVTKYYHGKDYILKYIERLKHDLYIIKNSITALAIRYIRLNVGYDQYLKTYCKNKNIDYDDIVLLLNSLEEESVGHNDISEFIKYIDLQCQSKVKNDISDSVNLMTFHLSKGLEFKVVFIVDANDQIIPHKKSIKDDDIETERRLFYVAMTRAKDYLHIFFTKKRLGKNYRVSRFIIETMGGKSE